MHIRNRRLNKKLNWKRRRNNTERAEKKTLHNLYITVLSCSLKYHSWRKKKNTCTAIRVDFYVLQHLTLHIRAHCCSSRLLFFSSPQRTHQVHSTCLFRFLLFFHSFLPHSSPSSSAGECVFRFTLFLFPHFLLEASFFSARSPFGPSVHPHLLRPLFCLYFFFFFLLFFSFLPLTLFLFLFLLPLRCLTFIFPLLLSTRLPCRGLSWHVSVYSVTQVA